MTLNSTAPDLRRELLLSARIGYLTVVVYQPPAKRDPYAERRMLAYVHSRIEDCGVYTGDTPCLWVESAAFDLTHAEARAVMETFGIRERNPARIAPTIEQETDEEIAAETAAREST